MNITIDASAAVHKRAGIGRYTQELITALLELNDSAKPEIRIFYNRAHEAHAQPPLDQLPHFRLNTQDKPWRLRVLLANWFKWSQDNLFQTNLFHATDNVLPYLSRTSSIFTLHDLTHHFYPQTQAPANRWYLQLMMSRFLRTADLITADSESSRLDAIKLYNLPTEKIHTVPLGVHPRFQPANPADILALRQSHGLPDKFLLHLGTIEPRKNLGFLLDALEGNDHLPLVIAGKQGWADSDLLHRLDDQARLGRVILLGYIPDEVLPILYSTADAFVFTSLYEGFGLPILEAMACGTPVICTNTSSLPEIAGDAALLVPPTDVRTLRQAMERLWDNRPLQAELSAKGRQRAAQFTWQRTAQQTLVMYHQLLEKPWKL